MSSRSRGIGSPELCIEITLFKIGGRREDRVTAAPGALAPERLREGRVTTGTGGITPAFPAQWTILPFRPLSGSCMTVIPNFYYHTKTPPRVERRSLNQGHSDLIPGAAYRALGGPGVGASTSVPSPAPGRGTL